jgi:hypothetical protein
MFLFDMKNMNTRAALDSIWLATSTLSGICGAELSLDGRTCKFYTDSFNSYKNILEALGKAGYQTEDLFGMSGPGLTCDIPSTGEEAESSIVPEISSVSSITEVQDVFNDNSDKIRVVTIPNPACLACVKGQRFINTLFGDIYPNENKLHLITVWTSIDGWGVKEDALRLAPELVDPRVDYFWDEEMTVGKAYKNTLRLKNDYLTAWDVYLVYAPGVLWNEISPPKPTFWMHQLTKAESGADETLMLDKPYFERELKEILVAQFDY